MKEEAGVVMKVYVTKADIEKGERSEPRRCPVANAIRRAANSEKVTVFPSKCFIDEIGYRLPKKAEKLICDFDSGKKVKPIRFEVVK